jgi:hypothetical protein
MDLVNLINMNYKIILSSPLMQIISFSSLLIGNDDFGGPLFLWIILNIVGNLYFSIFGFICLILPLSTYLFRFKSSNFTQLLTIFFMLLFVIFFGPGKYFKLYVLHNKLSQIEMILCFSSFLFFIIVNFFVVLKVINYYVKNR